MAGSDTNGQDPDTYCSECGNKLDENGNGHKPDCEWA